MTDFSLRNFLTGTELANPMISNADYHGTAGRGREQNHWCASNPNCATTWVLLCASTTVIALLIEPAKEALNALLPTQKDSNYKPITVIFLNFSGRSTGT